MLVASGNPLEAHLFSVADPGEGAGGPAPPLIFYDRAPTLSQGLDDRPRPLSEGLDPPLLLTP